MAQSPGHRKWPEHRVREEPLGERWHVEVGGTLVADSREVIKVDEDGHRPRYYFPRSDVRMTRLERSKTTSQCPFKGTAQYFSLKIADGTYRDVAWSYEDPFDEHRALKDRVAFHDEAPGVVVSPATEPQSRWVP